MTKKIGMSGSLEKVIAILIILLVILVTATLAKGSLDNADTQTTNAIAKNAAIAYCTKICITCFQSDCPCELPENKQYDDSEGHTIETLSCSDLGAEYTTTDSGSSEDIEYIVEEEVTIEKETNSEESVDEEPDTESPENDETATEESEETTTIPENYEHFSDSCTYTIPAIFMNEATTKTIATGEYSCKSSNSHSYYCHTDNKLYRKDCIAMLCVSSTGKCQND